MFLKINLCLVNYQEPVKNPTFLRKALHRSTSFVRLLLQKLVYLISQSIQSLGFQEIYYGLLLIKQERTSASSFSTAVKDTRAE
jgi:hypothetical protein